LAYMYGTSIKKEIRERIYRQQENTEINLGVSGSLLEGQKVARMLLKS
jgi:hypothetical protein